MTTTVGTFDAKTFAAAIERRDAQAQLAAYAPDAQLTSVDHEHPPSSPLQARGTAELGAYLDNICARDMSHSVRTIDVAGDRLTLEVDCAYPDGTRVACLSVAGIEGGRIAWQRQVTAWDH